MTDSPSPRVLVANRGEIAVRIIRAARLLGIETVAVYSEADRGALWTRLADKAVCVGPGPATASYLRADVLIQVAISTGCTMVHPGYGFLAENAEFAGKVAAEGLEFVGPLEEHIHSMGNKVRAREFAERAGVPVVPGYRASEIEQILADDPGRLRFPLLIKAAAGGGGKGMRLAENPETLTAGLRLATSEAQAAFGSGEVYVEKFVARGRHVEVQVFGDGRGGVVAVGERDCSVQRRHQKVVEEAPCDLLDEAVRSDLHEAARSLVSELAYRGAGTVEFIYDLDTSEFYFLEMNTRIQVEHTVTEELFGVDLVAAQLALASGREVDLRADQRRGHSLECRVVAEKGWTGRPTPGHIATAEWPGGPGVRVDTHCVSGTPVPPFYDSLLAKIVVTDRTREWAIDRMISALGEVQVEGVETNVEVLREILSSEQFRSSQHTTSWFEEWARDRT